MAFYQNGKEVVRVPAKLVEDPKRIDQTEVPYDTSSVDTWVIAEMLLCGWKPRILFPDSGEATKAGQ